MKKIIKAHHMANIFMTNIFEHHRFPESIVLDIDSCMTSLFLKGLIKNVETKLNFSFAYHSQMDGQSEIVNSTILDLLKCYVVEVNQKAQ